MNTRNYTFILLASGFILFNSTCHHQAENKEIIPSIQHLITDTVCRYQYVEKGTTFLKNGHIFLIDPRNAGVMYIWDVETGQKDWFVLGDHTDYPESLVQQLPFSFYQFDWRLRSYFAFSFENNQVKFKRVRFQFSDPIIDRVVQIGENKYVTLGKQSKLLGLYDNKSKEMAYFGHYPLPVNIPVDQNTRENIVRSFEGAIAYSDSHSMVVYGSFNYAYLSCYRYSGGKLKFQWEKFILPPPSFELVNGYIEEKDTDTEGRVSSVVTAGDYIFAGYRQRDKKDSKLDAKHSILVYDMKGNHLATLHTDCPVSIFAVDLDEQTIYGISSSALIDDAIYLSSNKDELAALWPHIVRFRFDASW